MAVIGSMSVNIVAITDKFISGINNARSKLGAFANSTTSLIGSIAGAAGLGAMLHQFDEMGSTLHDMSVKTGVTVENLSALKFAADQSGASVGTLSRAFKTMQKNGMDPNMFMQVAESINAIKDPVERAQAAMKAFGKVGPELLPMIAELPQLRAEFEKLGGTVTTDMANKADALGDSWGKLKLALSGVSNHIAAALAPEVTKLNEFMAANGKYIMDWIDNHKTLVTVIGSVLTLLTTLTPAVWAFNQACIALTTTLGALKAAAAVPIVAKILASAGGATALGIAGGVGGAVAGVGAANELYQMSKQEYGGGSGASRGWDVEVKNNTQKQVDQQKETNDLLRQSLKQKPVELKSAGVR